MSTAVLLVNLGTPNEPTPSSITKYLTEFLLDPRIIPGSWLYRNFLVRGLIIPRRKEAVSQSYRHIWMAQGSPLLVFSTQLQNQMQNILGNNYSIHLAMRYQEPSIQQALETISQLQVQHLIILPLFPQYASATTGSIFEKIMQYMQSWKIFPKITWINEFSTFEPYISALSQTLINSSFSIYDHVIFSFHGLPKNAAAEIYATHCRETARLTADKAGLSSWSVAFQSRLGKSEWLQPYLIDEITHMAHFSKKILIISPSFVVDCLETLYELSVEGKKEFIDQGGSTYDVVSCLNEQAAQPLCQLITSASI